MRVEALHHLVQEGLIERDPLFRGHAEIVWAVIHVAGTGGPATAGACGLL
jgi:hypothetical protein